MRRLVVVLALGVALLVPVVPAESAAAGSGDWPRCAKVWKVGKRLPRTYEGCKQGRNVLVPLVAWRCTNGKRLTGYRDIWWAFMGQKISRDKEAYDRAYWRCVGS